MKHVIIAIIAIILLVPACGTEEYEVFGVHVAPDENGFPDQDYLHYTVNAFFTFAAWELGTGRADIRQMVKGLDTISFTVDRGRLSRRCGYKNPMLTGCYTYWPGNIKLKPQVHLLTNMETDRLYYTALVHELFHHVQREVGVTGEKHVMPWYGDNSYDESVYIALHQIDGRDLYGADIP